MSSYSKNKKLVRDYINGNDIDIEIETLENDLDFMMEVIDQSNDKNLYKLCGEDIKYNYEMIKFLIEKFHSNSEFIIETVMEFLDHFDHTYWYKDYNIDYLEYSETSIEELEVLITIDKYLERKLDERIITIKTRLSNEYTKFRISLEVALEKSEAEKLKYEIGKGFNLVETLFPTSYLIKDYYATSIIDEILLGSNGNTFEKVVHNMISSKEKPESSIRVLIELVKKYDVELANYIIARQEPFTKYITEIDHIISNWDSFNERVINDKIYFILDVISDYYYKYGHLLCMEEFECVKYYAELLNLEEHFQALDPTSYECTSIPIPSKGKTYHDQKMFHDLTPIIQNIMQGGNEYNLPESSKHPRKKNNISTFRPKR